MQIVQIVKIITELLSPCLATCVATTRGEGCNVLSEDVELPARGVAKVIAQTSLSRCDSNERPSKSLGEGEGGRFSLFPKTVRLKSVRSCLPLI